LKPIVHNTPTTLDTLKKITVHREKNNAPLLLHPGCVGCLQQICSILSTKTLPGQGDDLNAPLRLTTETRFDQRGSALKFFGVFSGGSNCAMRILLKFCCGPQSHNHNAKSTATIAQICNKKSRNYNATKKGAQSRDQFSKEKHMRKNQTD
jgi:hypothetical protein